MKEKYSLDDIKEYSHSRIWCSLQEENGRQKRKLKEIENYANQNDRVTDENSYIYISRYHEFPKYNAKGLKKGELHNVEVIHKIETISKNLHQKYINSFTANEEFVAELEVTEKPCTSDKFVNDNID